MNRKSSIIRNTKETQIECQLNIDGNAHYDIDIGVGFFEHILSQMIRFSQMDLILKVKGDLHIDAHHTVEDIGIVLGQALDKALGDRKGIQRYGFATIPMDESLITVSLDLSGRFFYEDNLPQSNININNYNLELTAEFLRSFALHSRMNLHIVFHRGKNLHHIHEVVFKALGLSLKMAVAIVHDDIPSTKGILV